MGLPIPLHLISSYQKSVVQKGRTGLPIGNALFPARSFHLDLFMLHSPHRNCGKEGGIGARLFVY